MPPLMTTAAPANTGSHMVHALVGLARKMMENCALRHAGLDETKVIHG